MKILLVEDSARHRQAGITQLQALGHEVIAESTYVGAKNYLLHDMPRIDVALLDLLMPAEPTTLGQAALEEHLGREIAIGFPLALALASYGVKRIAVTTDTTHHEHPMSTAVDWFEAMDILRVGNSAVYILHAPLCADGTKDWGKILDQLLRLSHSL